MKERPILFNGEMVRAILDGRKTQTRRVIKQPSNMLGQNIEINKGLSLSHCPFGQPGDRLWVRETFVSVMKTDDHADGYDVHYAATDKPVEYYDERKEHQRNEGVTSAWKPSIHMPRWASRITLEITDVRVERLNDISGIDAVNEGIQSISEYGKEADVSDFKDLWETINGKGSWSQNPWVWVIEFKRII